MSALILISVLGVLVLYLGLFAKKSWLAPVGILGLLGAIALFYTGWHINHPPLPRDLNSHSTWPDSHGANPLNA